MANLAFLAIALAIFAIGSLIVWLRSRERTTFDSSINDFQSQLGALKPEDRITTSGVDGALDGPEDERGGSD